MLILVIAVVGVVVFGWPWWVIPLGFAVGLGLAVLAPREPR